MRPLVFVAALFLVVATGCNIDDEDRCPSGFDFDPELELCREVVDSGVGDASPDTSSLDGSDSLVDITMVDSSGQQGLGEPCTEDAQCVGFDADFCAYDPISATGYCTFKDCSPEECPAGYQCCDCAAVPVVGLVLCVTDADSQVLASMGCTCS